MKHKAIYPGTFDPVTNGHVDIITRAANLFPELIVAVANSSAKKPFFNLTQRIELVEQAIAHVPGVRVIGFEGLLINFAEEHGAHIIIRGLRAVSDFEYELQLAGMNRKLDKTLETIFLTPAEEHMFISASLVREIANLGGDISKFVPKCVHQAFSPTKRNISS